MTTTVHKAALNSNLPQRRSGAYEWGLSCRGSCPPSQHSICKRIATRLQFLAVSITTSYGYTFSTTYIHTACINSTNTITLLKLTIKASATTNTRCLVSRLPFHCLFSVHTASEAGSTESFIMPERDLLPGKTSFPTQTSNVEAQNH